jgi:hypothetical protein
MSDLAPERNCVDIVMPFRNQLEKAHLLDGVQLIGGIGSAALTDEASIILPDEATVIAPDGLYLPQHRADGNLRDLDVLVLSSNPGRIRMIEMMAKASIGDELEISVFGLRNAEHVEKQMAHPVLGLKALKTFVSDRYVERDGSIDKVVFPFSVPLEAAAMESYALEVKGAVFPIASPPGALMNYATRSISGLRPKDADKVEDMAANVFGKVPDYVDWIRTGPGRSQLELARVLHSLQGPSSFEQARTLTLGGAIDIVPMPIRALFEHEAFMLSDEDRRTQENALAWARVKSAVLHKAESYEEVVRLYQKWAERLFDGITKNS